MGDKMKRPTTYEEQLSLLKSRGLVINDDAACLDILQSINYYRLTAYLLPFKQSDDTFLKGTTFERVYRIYEFDRRLRSLLLSAIEEIELFLRTRLAYYSAHSYGALGYLEQDKYSDVHDHDRFIQSIEAAIKNNKNTPVVKHHNAVYGGKFPIWVIVEFFSIGNLSYFYSDWLVADKKYIAKALFNTTYPFMDSWMKCITVLRNRCAHYSRLYYTLFTDTPRIPPPVEYKCNKRIFDQILMLKFMSVQNKNWSSSFIPSLDALVEEYQEHIDFEHIGFPKNWRALLVGV